MARIVAKGCSPTETPVSEAMTPCPKTVVEDTPIETALAVMRRGRFRRVPVVGQENNLVGLVTLDDIFWPKNLWKLESCWRKKPRAA